MLVRIITAIATVLVLVFMAGCGGEEAATTEEPAAEQTAAAEETPAADETPAGGGGETDTAQVAAEELFVNSCGGCHMLSAAGTNGQIGPNLDELAPDVDTVLTAIRVGPGQMPENLLEGEEALAVAEYVADNAGR